ncbi:hypothetical protein HMPREF9140_01188 [Prevotella micans F0438]|jgi:GAF domain-containing protein A|uniref:GAF domain-containing protein n=1 Tax=Prevotella micans F0438 TaxID=883158 RepID=H1Q2Q0_9BACT|nr:GAF domain-containing protein [Prevotella micans]EHO70333.1 hypothetical protein HMPREF9140_01188 [Prevotella micans F0438]MBF1436199.1 GAF domain-containing protein [Prevotella micans]
MNKAETYEMLLKQIESLIEGEHNEISVLANVSSAIHHAFDNFFWTGFYLETNQGELSLAPFQGTPACYRIPSGRGVCGTAFAENRTLVVPDVEKFDGHIACSSLSRSEIVVPIISPKGTPIGVLDIDSRDLNTFDETDAHYLERIMDIVSHNLYSSR